VRKLLCALTAVHGTLGHRQGGHNLVGKGMTR